MKQQWYTFQKYFSFATVLNVTLLPTVQANEITFVKQSTLYQWKYDELLLENVLDKYKPTKSARFVHRFSISEWNISLGSQ